MAHCGALLRIGMCIRDLQEWNRGTELLMGFTKEEAVGKKLVQNFIADEFSDSVQTMLSQGMNGQELGSEITNYEFSLWTKSGQRKDILWSATARRDRHGNIVGVIGIGHDITELRSESKMLANYVRICGAAVWSLKGNAKTGVITDSKTREIEHLISQQAQMDICDPRMVLWRASFVSILKTMCREAQTRQMVCAAELT
ncbi:PHYB [Symbiodinium natans]|uniref:PHYB protein n=1 Tax=Symbiodinium natans TaxID=878477 RepID=A0A812J378_9DINO|nr:PHYB [Symbiodinium natans]